MAINTDNLRNVAFKGKTIEKVTFNGATVYEKWPVVTFSDGYSGVLKTQTVMRGYDATPPSTPTRAGYIFTGWSRSYYAVISSCTITAQWELSYLLSVSATSATVTVKRLSSSFADSGTITNGAIIYNGDLLEISVSYTFAANRMLTVNGTSIASGGRITVSGDVQIVARSTSPGCVSCLSNLRAGCITSSCSMSMGTGCIDCGAGFNSRSLSAASILLEDSSIITISDEDLEETI